MNNFWNLLLVVLFVYYPSNNIIFAKQEPAISISQEQQIVQSAKGVLERTTGKHMDNIVFSAIPSIQGRDVYEYSAANGRLVLKGSSAVALCRAFHDYAKKNHLGEYSWAGSYFRLPDKWPDSEMTRCDTPFEIRHMYNVCTAGYTFPYWTWERWEQELDWQALRGFNMLMAPVATEAIMERVWLQIGLTQEEIDINTCGPAHAPWYRMGNICGIEGPTPKHWNQSQIVLQHKILKRMRELGISPIVQSFAGFVPHAFKRIHPETKLYPTLWNNSVPLVNRPVLILPDDPQFKVLTVVYMKEWEKEFGKARYFLVDSFNEMAIPVTDKSEAELLTDYGAKTWEAIKAGDPDAIWAIQGWTFGYQNWSAQNLEALFSKVPDDRMLVLDYAHDYGIVWDKYHAFWNKSWVMGYLPNAGGKTPFNGNLQYYATHSAEVLQNPNKKNLKGFTISSEGLENNELLYELLTDMAWSHKEIELDSWLQNYALNRYGKAPENVLKAWNILRQGCYNSFHPHPGYKWQHFGGMDKNPNFYDAASSFLSCADELKDVSSYKADAVEIAALALSLKADEWYDLAKSAVVENDWATFDTASSQTIDLLTKADTLMESHPYHRLERWIDFARSHTDNEELNRFYEANAKCIVTYWTDGVQNYACRVWGGLIRDYYVEWLRREFASLKEGTPFDRQEFMQNYYKNSKGVSPFTASANPLEDAKSWLEQAISKPLPVIESLLKDGKSEQIGLWSPGVVSESWKSIEFNISTDQLARLQGVFFKYTKGNHGLDIQSVELLADGNSVALEKRIGFAGQPSRNCLYSLKVPAGTKANNGCVLRAVVKTSGGTDSYGAIYLISQ